MKLPPKDSIQQIKLPDFQPKHFLAAAAAVTGVVFVVADVIVVVVVAAFAVVVAVVVVTAVAAAAVAPLVLLLLRISVTSHSFRDMHASLLPSKACLVTRLQHGSSSMFLFFYFLLM